MQTPEQRRVQALQALASGNGIRLPRAALRRKLRQDRRHVLLMETIAEPPKCVESMVLYDLLVTTFGIGRVRAEEYMRIIRVGAAKQLGDMSKRQREDLVMLVERAQIVADARQGQYTKNGVLQKARP